MVSFSLSDPNVDPYIQSILDSREDDFDMLNGFCMYSGLPAIRADVSVQHVRELRSDGILRVDFHRCVQRIDVLTNDNIQRLLGSRRLQTICVNLSLPEGIDAHNTAAYQDAWDGVIKLIETAKRIRRLDILSTMDFPHTESSTRFLSSIDFSKHRKLSDIRIFECDYHRIHPSISTSDETRSCTWPASVAPASIKVQISYQNCGSGDNRSHTVFRSDSLQSASNDEMRDRLGTYLENLRDSVRPVRLNIAGSANMVLSSEQPSLLSSDLHRRLGSTVNFVPNSQGTPYPTRGYEQRSLFAGYNLIGATPVETDDQHRSWRNVRENSRWLRER